jgi:hypothetical protein
MDALKRAGIVTALPFVSLWQLTCVGVGAVSTIISFPFVAIYISGKYVITGKGVDLDKYLQNTFGVIAYDIGEAPSKFLINQAVKIARKNQISEAVAHKPPTIDELKAERTAQDAEAAAIQAKQREEILGNSK